jgi:DNA mismatch repair protein MutS2
LRSEAEETRDKLDQEVRAFEEKQAALLAKAKDDALEKIADADAYADIIRVELKTLLDEAGDFVNRSKPDPSKAGDDAVAPSRGDFYRRVDENRKQLRQLDGEFRAMGAKKTKGRRRGGSQGGNDRVLGARIEPKDVRIGDRVYILSLDSDGEVLTAPDGKGEVQVLIGRVRMTVPLKDLRASRAKNRSHSDLGGAGGYSGYSKLMRSKADSVSSSIDVHGQNLDEATANVDKYIDNAMLAGYGEVTVIHGRGEGILRAGLQRMLRQHRHVKRIRTAGPSEGGDGATIVTLR